MGLGVYPEVTLANARAKAAEMKDQIRRGIDPVEQRRSLRANLEKTQRLRITFAVAVESYLPIKSAELSAGKYRDNWRDSIDKYAIPLIGNHSVENIGLPEVLSVLEPIWREKNVTADKLRRKLNEILDFCTVKGHRSGANPARWEGNLSHALGSLAGTSGEEHYPALQFKDLSRFWSALNHREGIGAAALKFQILTATRTGAVRFMIWEEIDLLNKVWTVLPERQSSKIGKKDGAKRVPLTDNLLSTLAAMPRQHESDFVFRAPRGGALSDATLAKLMRVMHEADVKAGNGGFLDAKTKNVVVPHGTRSTFKNWAIEKNSL